MADRISEPIEHLPGGVERFTVEDEDVFARVTCYPGAGPPRKTVERSVPAALTGASGDAQVLAPPVDPNDWAQFPRWSTILPQCIRALVAGIEGHGYALVEAGWKEEDLKSTEHEARKAERERIRQWLDSAGGELTWQDLRERTRADIETVGFSGWELIYSGDTLDGIKHHPGRTLRLCKQSKGAVPMRRYIREPDGSGWTIREEMGHPRLVVAVSDDNDVVYFKEPGDPRRIDRTTGKTIDATDKGEATATDATEMVFLGPYNPGGVYPLPRWVGTAGAIESSHDAWKLNRDYLKEPIPSMLLLCSGGTLPAGTQDFLTDKFAEARKKGFRAVTVEAMSKKSGGVGAITETLPLVPQLEVVFLNEAQKDDAMFGKLDEANRNKVRSACGVHPIMTGESQDYTRATADAAVQTCESITFAPSRRLTDSVVDRIIFPRFGALWWRYQGKGPRLTRAEDIKIVAEVMEKLGIGGAEDAARLLAEIGIEVKATDQPWGALPFALAKIYAQQGLLETNTPEKAVAEQERFRAVVADVMRQAVEEAVERVLERAAEEMA